MKPALAILAILILFTIANRAAFEGYFSDDDFDNLSWSTIAGADSFSTQFLTPVFSDLNMRPTGALFYRWMGRVFHLDFKPYAAALFALHWLNSALLFRLARDKGASPQAAFAATLLFLFNASLLAAWWKPMYIFDLLAGTFCLATWLLFPTRFWLLALPAFWLAYKSKEIALFFPVILALENWRRAIPFLAISASFGLQAMRINAGRDTYYTLRFTPGALATTIPFYLKQTIFLAPLLYFAKEKALLQGLLGATVLLIPLLFLPTRLASVYLYVPLIPFIVRIAPILNRISRSGLALATLLWLALNYQSLRAFRKQELALAHETKSYINQLQSVPHLSPIAYYENGPWNFAAHGMNGALRLITNNPAAQVLNPEIEANRAYARDRNLPTLHWFRPTNKLTIVPHRMGESKLSSLDFANSSAVWQLKDGWQERQGNHRWAGPIAALTLNAPPNAKALKLRFQNLPSRVAIFLNNMKLGETGALEATLPLPAPIAGPTGIRLESQSRFALRSIAIEALL